LFICLFIYFAVYDWLPTAAALAGVDTSQFKTMDGANLAPILFQNKNPPSRDHILISLNQMCEYSNKYDKASAGIRVGDYKVRLTHLPLISLILLRVELSRLLVLSFHFSKFLLSF
jgi:arylsulfatase A-like enzyme